MSSVKQTKVLPKIHLKHTRKKTSPLHIAMFRLKDAHEEICTISWPKALLQCHGGYQGAQTSTLVTTGCKGSVVFHGVHHPNTAKATAHSSDCKPQATTTTTTTTSSLFSCQLSVVSCQLSVRPLSEQFTVHIRSLLYPTVSRLFHIHFTFSCQIRCMQKDIMWQAKAINHPQFHQKCVA